nr:cyclin Y-3 [Crypthecodinium cohnii]
MSSEARAPFLSAAVDLEASLASAASASTVGELTMVGRTQMEPASSSRYRSDSYGSSAASSPGLEPTLRRAASNESAMPAGFKATKRRKSMDFIVTEMPASPSDDGGGLENCEALLRARQPSMVDPELCDGSEDDVVSAAVARLVFRLIVEGRETRRAAAAAVAAAGTSTNAASSSAVVPRLTSISSVVSSSVASNVAGGSQPRRGLSASSAAASIPDTDPLNFNESEFFQPESRCRLLIWMRRVFCCRRRKSANVDSIFDTLQHIRKTAALPRELVMISAIYIERLVCMTQLVLTTKNWRSVVVAALLLASKVWEDVHPWNADFACMLAKCLDLRLIAPVSMYRLESRFLHGLDWKVCVSGEEYARYLFAIRDAEILTPRPCSAGRSAVHAIHTTPQRQPEEEYEPRPSSWCGPLRQPHRPHGSHHLCPPSEQGSTPNPTFVLKWDAGHPQAEAPTTPDTSFIATSAKSSGTGSFCSPSPGRNLVGPGGGSSPRHQHLRHGGSLPLPPIAATAPRFEASPGLAEGPEELEAPKRMNKGQMVAFLSKSEIQPAHQDSQPSSPGIRDVGVTKSFQETRMGIRCDCKLERSNPFVGSFRHAPPAKLPSRFGDRGPDHSATSALNPAESHGPRSLHRTGSGGSAQNLVALAQQRRRSLQAPAKAAVTTTTPRRPGAGGVAGGGGGLVSTAVGATL